MSMVASPGSDGDRDFVTIFKIGSVDRNDYPELAEHLLAGRTQLAPETGYLMRFGDVSHRGLTTFDVASLHDVPAYPLPGAALGRCRLTFEPIWSTTAPSRCSPSMIGSTIGSKTSPFPGRSRTSSSGSPSWSLVIVRFTRPSTGLSSR